MANVRLIFIACNIYSILDRAFMAVHSDERCGPWASGYCRESGMTLKVVTATRLIWTEIQQYSNCPVFQVGN